MSIDTLDPGSCTEPVEKTRRKMLAAGHPAAFVDWWIREVYWPCRQKRGELRRAGKEPKTQECCRLKTDEPEEHG